MYEGKNIHYSPVDQKPLCSFSGKVCNQRRLNKYGFCVRHILEDPNAPFKRCAYVAKSSRQTCTQPIPKNEEREYCNNHMQVLGMLPKKARKPKKEKVVPSLSESFSTQPGTMSVPLLLQSRNKPKLTVSGFKSKHPGKLSSIADMEDVYAFPADVSDNVNKSNVSTMITSVAIQDLTASSKSVTYSTFTTNTKSNEGAGSHSSLAKIYPELAEKLEKIKPKLVDPKLKGKVKSSRTMNSLQSKIAQNKIKDKLKRNQSSSNASSQSQSPSHGFTNVNSPGCRVSPASSPNVPVPVSSPSAVQTSPNSRATPEISSSVTNSLVDQTGGLNVSATNLTPQQQFHGLSQFNLLNTLNLQSLNSSLAQLGFPVPAASDIEQILQQLAKAANISLEGAPTHPDGKSHASHPPPAPIAGLQGPGFPRQPDLLGVLKPSFTSLSGPPPPYSSIHHKPSVSVTPAPHTGPVLSSSGGSTSTLCVTDSVKLSSSSQSVSASSLGLQRPCLSEENISKVVPSKGALSTTESLTSSLQAKESFITKSPAAMLPPSTSSVTLTHSSTADPGQQSPGNSPQSLPGKPRQQEALEHNVSNVSPVKQRPPKLKSRSRNTSALSKRPVPVFTLPMTLVKPQKIRKILSDDELKKFKEKSAINYYKKYKLRKECNHDLIISGFDSSDDSDLSDCDMLPWQPDWFKASSDEECCDEDESDYDLRPTKLALARAQLRRQCFQARQSYRANRSVFEYNNDSTSTLIQAAKDGVRHAVSTLNEINGKLHKPVDRYKTRGLDRRRCLYKDNEEVQCKGNVVPYTNHCIKHVMYNVDQQLFEYCTAKFADNTQCCHPVIDLKHELPLCMEHGLKADNFLKTQEAEPKPKRPRKKTKPSALTRPPKKGKKKKNQRKSAQQQLALSKTEEDSVEAQESEEDHPVNDSENEAVDMEEEEEGDEEAEMEEQDVQTTSAPSKSALLKASSTGSKSTTVKPDSKHNVIHGERKSEERKSSTSQLEELENLTGLQELDNVKMFGDLPLENASKLLEENDFQEVLNRLPDEAFDLFNKTSALPSNEELDELEKSLAMANRDLRYAKDSIESYTSSTPDQTSASQLQQPPASFPPILDDADELTRQIAEEILKQNIGNESGGNESSMCNGDAQESIKAIAQSLSTSGMLLTSDVYQRPQVCEENTVIPSGGMSLSRSHSSTALSSYNSLGQGYNPPSTPLQTSSMPKTRVSPSPNPSNNYGLTKGQVQVSTAGPSNFIPRNYAMMPQGMFQTQLPLSTHSISQPLVPTPGVMASSVNTVLPRTTTTTAISGTTNFASGPHITAFQLSQLVQQAGLQLPPVPPYVPRQSTSQGVVSQQPVIVTSPPTMTSQLSQQSVTVTSLPTTASPLSQQHGGISQQPVTVSTTQTVSSQLLHQQQLQAQQQQLTRQREQLTQQQQHLLTQQLLQQHLLALAQQQAQQTQLVQTLQQQAQANQGKTQPLLTPNVNISALLQQGQKFNHLPSMSSTGSVTMPQLIKANYPISQKTAATSTVLGQVSLPTANIVWTAPPNVTITSSNGFSRNLLQGVTSSGITSTVGTSVDRSKEDDMVIDLTDSNDPPAYQSTEKVFTTQPPPSYLSKAVSSSRGKS